MALSNKLIKAASLAAMTAGALLLSEPAFAFHGGGFHGGGFHGGGFHGGGFRGGGFRGWHGGGFRGGGWRGGGWGGGWGGPAAVGVIGGLALGAVAASAYPYGYGYGYRSCGVQNQPVYDGWGQFVGYRPVRVCY